MPSIQLGPRAWWNKTVLQINQWGWPLDGASERENSINFQQVLKRMATLSITLQNSEDGEALKNILY